jgi:cellulose synthase/poly-beta-1,6-N-acetylglucosamine synthase-like glycosyltransferase
MTAFLLACGACVFFLLAAHPFVTYPLSLKLIAARRRARPASGPATGRMAICVCAYNEQDVIAARIENMIAMRRQVPDLEILLYVDAATDNTAAIARTYAQQIRLIVATERHGKTHGMNTLVSQTKADIVVFSDANVRFAEDAVARLLAPFGDPEVGCVCGHLVYEDQAGDSSTSATGSLYWRFEEQLKSLETKSGSVMGADGSIFAVRRALYRPAPPHLIDDMYVSLSVLCAGARIVRVADARAYESSVSVPAEEFRRKIRISCQAFNVNRALWNDLMRLSLLDRYKYISHKLLRWLTIYLLAAAALLAMASVDFALGPVASLIGLYILAYAAFAISQAETGPAGKLREAFAAFLATGIGVWQSIRGATYQVWNPPLSARTHAAKALAGSGIQA